ncbi:MAG: hypothetical protein ABIJ40_08680 [Bacteroidota bacterium]|nr:hypothetical protein [bacterium]MBU1873950.1 hypothetical protein [bacterium]
MISLKILPIPYPYKAMLSLTNDIDQCSWNKFLDFHQYFNTDKVTEFGPGLNIEVGNSFWFFQNPSADEYAFSYFNNLNHQKSNNYKDIIDLNKRGYLDCLHTWGNFSKVGGFKREFAEKAIDECINYSIKCPVWINHGDKYNIQNLITGLGDDPESNYYSSDLLHYLHTKFLWVGEITSYIGQDRKFTVPEIYFNDNSSAINRIQTYTKLFCKILLLGHIFSPNSNSLLKPVTLRDNQKMIKFVRYGFWNKAKLTDLDEILSEQVIEKLLFNNGKMCIYIHLAKNCTKEAFQKVSPAFNRLAELYHHQKLLICTTSRLLNFALAIKALKTEIIIRNSTYFIYLTFPSIGEDQNSNYLLDGLSFAVKSYKNFVFLFNNKEVQFQKKFDPTLKKWILYNPWNRLS